MSYRRHLHGTTPLDGMCVLVAEDEPLLAMDLEMALEDAGAVVLGPAASLSKALELAQAATIDAAILDVNLRGEEVYPAAQALSLKGVAILFHTAHGRAAELESMFPGAGVCMKPVSPEVLVRRICELAEAD